MKNKNLKLECTVLDHGMEVTSWDMDVEIKGEEANIVSISSEEKFYEVMEDKAFERKFLYVMKDLKREACSNELMETNIQLYFEGFKSTNSENVWYCILLKSKLKSDELYYLHILECVLEYQLMSFFDTKLILNAYHFASIFTYFLTSQKKDFKNSILLDMQKKYKEQIKENDDVKHKQEILRSIMQGLIDIDIFAVQEAIRKES